MKNTTTEQLALVRSVDPETCSPEEQEIIATGAAVLQLDILRENEKKTPDATRFGEAPSVCWYIVHSFYSHRRPALLGSPA